MWWLFLLASRDDELVKLTGAIAVGSVIGVLVLIGALYLKKQEIKQDNFETPEQPKPKPKQTEVKHVVPAYDTIAWNDSVIILKKRSPKP